MIYTFEDGRADYLCQFLWYGERYAQLAPDRRELVTVLEQGPEMIAILDRKTFSQVGTEVTDRQMQVLGEAGELVCVRVFQ